MITAVSLFVSISFAATGILYLLLYSFHRRRKSDLGYGLLSMTLAVTYALYAFESSSRLVYRAEAVIDGIIGILLVYNLRKLIQYVVGNKHAGHH